MYLFNKQQAGATSTCIIEKRNDLCNQDQSLCYEPTLQLCIRPSAVVCSEPSWEDFRLVYSGYFCVFCNKPSYAERPFFQRKLATILLWIIAAVTGNMSNLQCKLLSCSIGKLDYCWPLHPEQLGMHYVRSWVGVKLRSLKMRCSSTCRKGFSCDHKWLRRQGRLFVLTVNWKAKWFSIY